MQDYDPIDKPLSPKDVDDKLNEVFEIAPVVEKVPVERVTPKKTDDEDSDTDFQYTRENLYNIIERGSDAMEGLLEIARETEHPRAYEVVGQLIDKLTNANKELIGLHKTMQTVKEDLIKSPTNVTNALFVGSTADLQKLLKQNKETKK
ncbi:MAG: terminase [Acidimicrobiaceae bacterium]|nr:terminase [Acidimicrobiaceae bacterium]|tara:strand:- start:572 stop:1018 length:447 start_codon:yes stop_codon:yes gene_type:complete